MKENPIRNTNLRKVSFSNQINIDINCEPNCNDSFPSNSLVDFIKCLPSLKFIGPSERWNKGFSSIDLLKALSQLQEYNLDVSINYQRHNHNISNIQFDIQNMNPWQHRYVADKGKVPEPKSIARQDTGSIQSIKTNEYQSDATCNELSSNHSLDQFEWTWGLDGKLTVVKVNENHNRDQDKQDSNGDCETASSSFKTTPGKDMITERQIIEFLAVETEDIMITTNDHETIPEHFEHSCSTDEMEGENLENKSIAKQQHEEGQYFQVNDLNDPQNYFISNLPCQGKDSSLTKNQC